MAAIWNLPVVFVCGLIEGEFPRHDTAASMEKKKQQGYF